MNTMFVVKNNKKEVNEPLKVWVGKSRSVLFKALKVHGIDEEVYHGGAIIGRGILKYAESYEDIFEYICDEYRLTASQAQYESIEIITNLWSEVWKVFSSFVDLVTTTRHLTPEEIESVEGISNKLYDVLIKMVEDPPIQFQGVEKIQFNKSIKMHCIFAHHITDWAIRFHNVGMFSEQNVESIHAKWNTISILLDNLRGIGKLSNEIHYFDYNNDPEVNEEVSNIIKYTERYTPEVKEARRTRRETIRKEKEQKRRAENPPNNYDVAVVEQCIPIDLRNKTFSTREFPRTYSKCDICGKEQMDWYMNLHKYHIHSVCDFNLFNTEL